MSLKNKWRQIGALQIRRETSRLCDGTPWGDVLWFRTPKTKDGRRVAYVNDRMEGDELWLGLGIYWPTNKPHNAIVAAHAIKAYLAA
jgi:hypothetical protein